MSVALQAGDGAGGLAEDGQAQPRWTWTGPLVASTAVIRSHPRAREAAVGLPDGQLKGCSGRLGRAGEGGEDVG